MWNNKFRGNQSQNDLCWSVIKAWLIHIDIYAFAFNYNVIDSMTQSCDFDFKLQSIVLGIFVPPFYLSCWKLILHNLFGYCVIKLEIKYIYDLLVILFRTKCYFNHVFLVIFWLVDWWILSCWFSTWVVWLSIRHCWCWSVIEMSFHWCSWNLNDWQMNWSNNQANALAIDIRSYMVVDICLALQFRERSFSLSLG